MRTPPFSLNEKSDATENVVNPITDVEHSCGQPIYPAESRRLNETGSVVLKFLIDVKGLVKESGVETTSGYARLDQAALEALSKCKFKPGASDGLPKRMWSKIKYTWKLNEQSIEEMNAHIQQNPQDASAYLQRGLLFGDKGNYYSAVADFDTVISISPQTADAYIFRAIAQIHDGEIDQAMDNCDKAIEINPRIEPVYGLRGIIWLAKGNIEREISDLNIEVSMNT